MSRVNEREKGGVKMIVVKEGTGILEWCRDDSNSPESENNMIYKDAKWHQVVFIRDTIGALLSVTSEDYKAMMDKNITVVSLHRSKSVILPVYKIKYKGFVFYLRDNFYNWMVSVEVPNSFDVYSLDFRNENLFDTNTFPGHPEGFSDEWVFGSYKDNKRKFTFETKNDYSLYTFFYLIKTRVK